MSDYNNRIKEWITNLVIEELREDEEWWNKMSADQQKDYIRQHPQSQKAMDAKKEKEKDSTLNVDSANAEEIEDWYDKNKDKITDEADREELSDMIRGLSVTQYDLEVANDGGDEYEEAEYLQNQIQDYKDDIKGLISKYDTKPSDDKPAKPNKDDIEDINNGSALDSFINKYDFSDDEEYELYQIQKDMDKGYTSPEGAQAKITRLLGLEKELSYTPPQVKQKVAGSADAREVRNNVMDRLGRAEFDKLSYGQLQQAYDDEFEKLGWKKDGKNWVKQESVEETKKRDYKAEYKKFQSSTKAKKYRAELNKYNRKKGTYGNGDGKDASHKGGKIVGFEAQSKNRGRAEKSRLKKESLQENLLSFYQYMGDFYGKKGLYPDKKGRDLKVGDVNKALSVYLKKYAKDTFTGDSLDRERVRDILIKMKKIDPRYKKQEVKENKDKVKKYMMSKGDTEEDANEKLKYYDYIKKTYKGITPARMATIMGHLAKMESVSENIDGQIKNMMDRREKMKKSGASTSAINSVTQMIKKLRDRKRKSNESVNEVNMAHVLSKDLSKKKFKDLGIYLWHVLDLAINKDFRITSNGKLLAVNVDKINPKSLQNIKKRFGVDLQQLAKESVNERDNVGMAYKRTLHKVELKKIKDAILMFQKKIKKQGRVTNARDEEHLKNLIKVYKQMGGKGVKESREASIIQHHQRQLDALVQQYPDSYSRPYPIQTKIETLRNIIAVTKKKMGESINEDVYAIVDKFNQKKQDYDQVYFKDNNLNKVKKHMKKMGKKYGKMNLIKVKTNGKMSLVEAVSKSQAQEIMRQLGGRKFEMLMGVKSKGVGKDGLILHIGRNPKKVSHIVIDLDRGKDLYNLTFGKIFKYQFKVVKKLKGVGVEQLHDTIEKYTGLLTTFRKR